MKANIETFIYVLKRMVEKLSARSFSEIALMHLAEEKLLGRDVGIIVEGVEVECLVAQHFAAADENWYDVLVLAYDANLIIGANVIFNEIGPVELPRKVMLHRYEGLPMPIASF